MINKLNNSIDKLENNTGERYCARILGLLFTFLGIAGFFPAFVSLPDAVSVPVTAEPYLYTAGYGYLFGLFPTNLVHNLIHLSVGLFGLTSSTDAKGARVYCRVFAYAYIVIALLGLLPFTRTLFGLMPIFGNNVWFNALTAVVAAYFGFIKPTVKMDAMPSLKS